MVGKHVTVSSAQAGTKRIDLPEYAGKTLLLLRGGHPFTTGYTVLSTGGFEITNPTDQLVENEVWTVFADPALSSGIGFTGFGLSQYPHTIEIYITTGSVKTAGNWSAGSTTLRQSAGRYEPKSGNGTVEAVDGSRINYDGIVYLPLPQQAVAPGAKVVVKKGAEVLLQSTVKRFSAGQLNARIWL